jgi:hypothetical protein
VVTPNIAGYGFDCPVLPLARREGQVWPSIVATLQVTKEQQDCSAAAKDASYSATPGSAL